MFLSNPASYLVLLAAILATLAGCRWTDSNGNLSVSKVQAPKEKAPFKTREPENFQCDIIETAGNVVRRKRLAMKGQWSRLDLDLDTKDHRTILVTDKEYLIDHRQSAYAERPRPTSQPGSFSETARELLLRSPYTEYEEIGRDEGIIRYRTRIDGSENSEIILHYDPAIELPVKQEFFSLLNGERTLAFTVEIANLSLEPDTKLFEVPVGFKKLGYLELAGKR